MKPYLGLIVVLIAATVGADLVNINDQVDQSLEKDNEKVRRTGRSTSPFHVSHVVGKVTLTKGVIIGLDSEVRTDNCTVSVKGTTKHVDIHIGFSLLGIVIQDLKINGDEMSAFVRIRDNSIHFSYFIHNDTKCYVSVENINFERLTKAELAASRPKYDGLEVGDFIQTSVLPRINDFLITMTPTVQHQMQAICGNTHSALSLLPDVLLHMFS